MADRTSAGLFGRVFELLAKNPTEEHKEIAKEIYRFTGEYDFSPYQMSADEACLTLGIARMGINLECSREGEVVLWPDDEGYDEAK